MCLRLFYHASCIFYSVETRGVAYSHLSLRIFNAQLCLQNEEENIFPGKLKKPSCACANREVFLDLMAPHSSTLAWKIPWTAEPGRLQSMGSSPGASEKSGVLWSWEGPLGTPLGLVQWKRAS